jgi:hypothetical protein
MNLSDSEGLHTYYSPKLFLSSSASPCNLTFHEGGWDPSGEDGIILRPRPPEEEGEDPITWEFGVDVARADAVEDPTHVLTKKSLSYEKVSDEFVLVVGQKVGIAVFRKTKITNEDAGAPAEMELSTYFGQPNVVSFTVDRLPVSRRTRAFSSTMSTLFPAVLERFCSYWTCSKMDWWTKMTSERLWLFTSEEISHQPQLCFRL